MRGALEYTFGGFISLVLAWKHLELFLGRELPLLTGGIRGIPTVVDAPVVDPVTGTPCLAWALELRRAHRSGEAREAGTSSSDLLHSQADVCVFRLRSGRQIRTWNLTVPRIAARGRLWSGNAPEVRRAVEHFGMEGLDAKDGWCSGGLDGLFVRLRRVELGQPVTLLEAEDGCLLSEASGFQTFLWVVLRTALLAGVLAWIWKDNLWPRHR